MIGSRAEEIVRWAKFKFGEDALFHLRETPAGRVVFGEEATKEAVRLMEEMELTPNRKYDFSEWNSLEHDEKHQLVEEAMEEISGKMFRVEDLDNPALAQIGVSAHCFLVRKIKEEVDLHGETDTDGLFREVVQ